MAHTMPLKFLLNLTSRERTLRTNRQLGCLLAFIAGAINARGFLAVRRYTSHMTGLVRAARLTRKVAAGRSGQRRGAPRKVWRACL